MSLAQDRRGDFVQSLERGLAVIRAFDSGRRELTLSEVALGAGITRAAARRFLLTLVALDYVRIEGKLFSLRPRVLELGHAYLSSGGLAAVQPHVEDLAGTLRETCSLGVLDRGHVVYVLRVPSGRERSESVVVGSRVPAYASAMGRVLLAALPLRDQEAYLAEEPLEPLTRYTIVDGGRLAKVLERVRSNGFAVTDQERREGVQSAAAPVRDQAGKVVAAIDVAVPASPSSIEDLRDRIVPAVLATARRIEAELVSRERSLH